ncbi:MAG TPA: FecR/PupR family sigma factor regulator, partial [Erythrobacter sp.]|nr:FecR/PupR family sigma factor regulator [Erythrobacter sp.]
MTHDNQILEQAAIWAVRTGEPDFVDWDGFIEWLEADPAHAEAYDRVKAGVEDAAEAIGNAAAPVNDNETVGPMLNRRWFALAASIAAAIT